MSSRNPALTGTRRWWPYFGVAGLFPRVGYAQRTSSRLGYDEDAPPDPRIGRGIGSKCFPSSRIQGREAATSLLFLPMWPR